MPLSRSALAGLAALLLLAPVGCGGPADQDAYNVLLVTVDTLRADHLGAYGYTGIHTPTIDGLAQRGVRFDRAYTSCPVTLPAHVSIMTGTYPPAHGVRSNGIFRADDRLITLAEVLRGRGYATAAVIGAVVLDSRFGLNQGFDAYDDAIAAEGPAVTQLIHPERSAADVTRLAQAFLEHQDEGPFFLWAHYFDPHTLYRPPQRFAEQYPGAPYDGEIAYVDEQLGLLLKTLERRGLDRKTIVILAGDHGEGLGEHGEDIHGALLYDPTLRVPLIIAFPGMPSKERVISDPVSVVDIMPTVLDLLRVEPGDWSEAVQGTSLAPWIAGRRRGSDDPIYFETLLPFFDYGWAGLRGVRRGPLKYIDGPTPGLYDTDADPGESRNLYAERPDDARVLHDALLDMVQRISVDDAGEASAELDAQTRAQLSALGYVSGAVHGGVEGDPFAGPDPESRIWIVSAINGASYRFLQGQHAEALAELERVRAAEPENPTVLNLLGVLNASLGRLEQAEGFFLALTHNQPDREQHWGNLGVIYRRQSRVDDAMRAFQRALEINPNYTEALYNLSLIHLERGEDREAEAGFERVVQLEPNNLRARNRLGVQYANRGELQRAIEQFEQALQLDPELGETHRNLAVCYASLEDYAQAARHLAEARRLGVAVPSAVAERIARGSAAQTP